MEGVSYAEILKNLKSRVNPEELGVEVGGIRETRTKDLLVEIKCAAGNRGKLDSAFRDAVGESGSVRHLVPMVEVEILDVDPTVEEEEVAKAVRSCLREEPSACVKVSLTKKPFRGTRKAFVRLEEASALTLLKATHLRSGGSPVGSAGKRSLFGVTALSASAIWRLTAGRQIAKDVAEGAARRDTPRRPAQGNRGATSAPHERRSPGMTIFRGQCVARRSERRPQIGGLEEAAKRESKLAAEKSAEVRRIAPIDKALKFKAYTVSGSLSGEETGEF